MTEASEDHDGEPHGDGDFPRESSLLVFCAFSATLALFLSPWPWYLLPLTAALIGGTWIWTRPEA